MQTQYQIGDVFKYHNLIVTVAEKTAEHIICVLFFPDSKTSNVRFTIPIKKIDQIRIEPVTAKPVINKLLKDLAENQISGEEELFGLNGIPTHKFTIHQVVEAVKILFDQKNKSTESVSANRTSKLRYFKSILSKEIAVAYNKNEEWADDQINKSLEFRKTISL